MSSHSKKVSLHHVFLKRLGRFVKHPATKLTVGLILVFTSGTEVVEDLMDDIPGIKIGAHHGLLVLGLLNAISSIPDMVEGLEKALESSEVEQDQISDE